ncbi:MULTISPECIES: pyridoxamine 5'-phosphate oxidase family protein [Paenibacillus]|uniref:pyridoxamine 5'-phosphate oxidase family protein n=1 Tax=Paenibacillus TaxID=44249 RepID=UPI00035D1564|nr:MULTISPECIES: pyridoxamine 5'-phosphate oxidase family protein [Paenibacillus]
MRRKEFTVEEQQELEQFLGEVSFGFLGLAGEDGWPRVIPLNFAYGNGVFYMHGSRAGEKMKLLREDNKVTFSAAREYALIPSYFTDEEMACPATAFFKSVTVRGHAEVVTDLEEKAMALGIFMQKLQPEGGYDPITTEDPRYIPRLKGVALIKIIPDEWTAKFKFGQNVRGQEREQIISGLQQRGSADDLSTLEMMEKYCPYHQSAGGTGNDSEDDQDL